MISSFKMLFLLILTADFAATAGSLGGIFSPRGTGPGHRCLAQIGQRPGTFVEGRDPGSRWSVLGNESAHLPLLNLLQAYAAAGPAAAPSMPPTVSILLLGDSVDWRMMAHICERFLRGSIRPVRDYPQRRDEFTYCDTTKRVKMGALYLPGVDPTGPYAWRTVKGNDLGRLNETVRLFRLAHGEDCNLETSRWHGAVIGPVNRGSTPCYSPTSYFSTVSTVSTVRKGALGLTW